MFTSAQVSSLALRCWFLLWCGLSLYAKLVIRWDVVGNFDSACTHWIFTCKQKESSLEVKSSDCLHIEASCIYTSSACNWYALGALDVKGTCFLKHKLVKCPYLWQDLQWYFLAGHLNPSTCLESLHLEHLSLLVRACLGSNLLLYGGTCYSLVWHLWMGCLDLKAFLLCLPGGRSVHWCLIRLISAALGSLPTCLMCHAVALDASIVFASCLTLLAGNLSRSILLSLMVLDTNASSFKKNQKMSQCKMFAVFCWYFARHTWACTALYLWSTDLLPWQKLVSRSNLVLTSLALGLQKSSYLDPIVSKLSL